MMIRGDFMELCKLKQHVYILIQKTKRKESIEFFIGEEGFKSGTTAFKSIKSILDKEKRKDPKFYGSIVFGNAVVYPCGSIFGDVVKNQNYISYRDRKSVG